MTLARSSCHDRSGLTDIFARASLLDRYGSQLAGCRERLRAVAFECGGEHVAAMVKEAKLLRATLVFASGTPLGAPTTTLTPAAVSIELLHLASLVHDDIIDEAKERRGVPALHVAAGRDAALVVGDLLIVGAFDELRHLRTTTAAETYADCVEVLGEGAHLCCLGQLEELASRNGARVEQRYLEVVARKTGSLFSVAASLGALLAATGDEQRAALARLGTALGTAYQVRDDLGDGAEDAPKQPRGPGTSAARFAPTAATYATARAEVLAALGHVPAPCADGLRALAEAMQSSSLGA